MRRSIISFLAVLVLLAVGVLAGRWLRGGLHPATPALPGPAESLPSAPALARSSPSTLTASRPLTTNPAEPSWAIFRGDRALTGVFKPTAKPPLRIKWRFVAKGAVKSSPVLWAGRVFFGSDDGNVYCLDVNDGAELWKFSTGMPIEAPPLLLDAHVIIGAADGTMLCLSADGGREIWRYKTADKILGSANWFDHPTAGQCIVFGSYDNCLHCLSADRGAAVWKYETENYVNGAPAIASDVAVIGGCDGNVHVVNIVSGQAQRRIPGGKYIASSPAVADGVAYVGNHDDSFLAFNLASGETVWEMKPGQEGFYASAAVAGERVIAAGLNGTVYCLQRSDGKIIWHFDTASAINASPVVAGDTVLVAGGDGKLYLLALADGQKFGQFNAGSTMTATPAVGANIIVIGCDDGSVYGLEGVSELPSLDGRGQGEGETAGGHAAVTLTRPLRGHPLPSRERGSKTAS